MSNFMKANYPPHKKYPSFRKFYSMIFDKHITPTVGASLEVRLVRIMLVVTRAVLMMLYHSVPKPEIFEEFGLKLEENDTQT